MIAAHTFSEARDGKENNEPVKKKGIDTKEHQWKRSPTQIFSTVVLKSSMY